MTSHPLADTWKRARSSAKNRWSTFIHDGFPPIPEHNRDRLVAFIQERCGYTRERAEGEIRRRFAG